MPVGELNVLTDRLKFLKVGEIDWFSTGGTSTLPGVEGSVVATFERRRREFFSER